MQCPKCGVENPDESQICGSCGHVLKNNEVEQPLEMRRVSRLAIISFVLGFLTLFLYYFAAIPSILLAFISIVRINKSAGKLKGRTYAIAAILISIFLMLTLYLWSFDAPPISNDYTVADFRSAPPHCAKSFRLLLSLNLREPNVPDVSVVGLSETDILLLDVICNILDDGKSSEISQALCENKEQIERAWLTSQEARGVISELNMFSEIADLTEPEVDEGIMHVTNTIHLARLYQAYIFLQIEQGDYQNLAKELIEFDSVIRKLSLNARPLITKIMCFVCLVTNVKTANAMINNPQTSREMAALLAEHFTPLTKEHISLRNSLLSEYLLLKNAITKELIKDVKKNTPSFKINSTLRLYRNFCDYCIYVLESPQEIEFQQLSVWPTFYPKWLNMPADSVDNVPWFYRCYNPVGSMITRVYNKPPLDGLLEKANRIKVYDDLLQIVINTKLGNEISLKARAYSDEYIVDLENKKIFSPGRDGIPHTEDDIFLPINPDVLKWNN